MAQTIGKVELKQWLWRQARRSHNHVYTPTHAHAHPQHTVTIRLTECHQGSGSRKQICKEAKRESEHVCMPTALGRTKKYPSYEGTEEE